MNNFSTKRYPTFNRDLSWLSFNYRVLQEALSTDVPLFERLRFLAIYSSNLDEFYRVRVASYQYLLKYYSKTGVEKKGEEVEQLLEKIKRTVDKQQQKFGVIFSEIIIPQLKSNGIVIIKDQQRLSLKEKNFLNSFFKKKVIPHLKVDKLEKKREAPFLENKKQYLALCFELENGKCDYYLVNIPVGKVERFIKIPHSKELWVIQLADLMRMHISELIPKGKMVECRAVKNSRDAELYLEDAVGETIVEKIKESIGNREIGEVTRFLYDENISKNMIRFLRKKLGLKKINMIPGGRYHNFSDFFAFPFPKNEQLSYPEFPSLLHPQYKIGKSYFDWVSENDVLLHFPYQQYQHVLDYIEEAANDKNVISIKISLYRVANDSKVCKALIMAAQSGKEVLVFNEVKARFDEESNIYWGEELQKAGAKVVYSFDRLKVHSKICLITRNENDKQENYGYFGTGNFNEKTSTIYCDHTLLTKDKSLTADLAKVFKYLSDTSYKPKFESLLVAPFNMRDGFVNLLNNEIIQAKLGNKARATLKMNSLEDDEMIQGLYRASQAGVKITIIVRGICCLIPGVKGVSENCKVISIVDRYLEHGRIFHFHNQGDDLLYLASADWMRRNLSRRVEVGFPIKDIKLKAELLKILNFQFKDNTKARVLNKTQSNPYKKSKSKEKVRTQFDTYRFLKELESS